MPVSEAALGSALADLRTAWPEGADAVTSCKMFGGAGFYAEGVFFAILDDDRLFFKVSPESAVAYDAEGMEPWYIPGDPKPKAYREVPAAWRVDAARLRAAMDEAISVARAGSAGKKRR
ncbi:MAG: TfoX/Sxy family protein [Fimbriimonadaceae bacterium]|nr:TfoX/Sxy family protein [Fimbriimonadaceae bacterium]